MMTTTDSQCRNCSQPVYGEYCANCGQREGRGDLHFGDYLADMVGDFFTWDSRVWRTLLPLLFRPGFLSAEFNVGRRARYMPPFRLYIAISFVLFLIISLSADNALLVGDSAADPDVEKLVADTKVNDDDSNDFELGISPPADAPAWQRKLAQRLSVNAERASDDPSAYADRLVDYLPQMMFLMLPLFAALLKLVYLLRPFHYLQHLVFALHYHSFSYLLYLLSLGVEKVGLQLNALYLLILWIYLLLALRQTYGSAWPEAILKTLALSFAYGLALLLGFSSAAIAVLVAM